MRKMSQYGSTHAGDEPFSGVEFQKPVVYHNRSQLVMGAAWRKEETVESRMSDNSDGCQLGALY